MLAAVSWWVWYLLDSGLGRSLPAQIAAVGTGLAIGYAAFFACARLLAVQELETLIRLRRARA